MIRTPRGFLSLLSLFAITALLLLLIKLRPTIAQSEQASPAQTDFGLATATFSTPQGKIQVNMPDDAAAGDQLSLSVQAQPSGNSDQEKTTNLQTLNSYSIQAGNEKAPVSSGVLKWAAPAQPGTANLILTNASGTEVGRVAVPVGSQDQVIHVTTPGSFVLPNVGQAGRPLTIWGPFDGDSATTSVEINGKLAAVLAESPRKTVVQSPSDSIGLVSINVDKNGAEASGVARNCAVRVSAPTSSLEPGATTELNVEVKGLAGIDEDIPLLLVNHNEAVVGLSGGASQTIFIRPEDVGPDGNYSLQRTLTGRTPGAFDLTAEIAEPRPAILYHGALLDRDFHPLENVPPDVYQGFTDRYANPPILADEGEGLPLPPLTQEKPKENPPKENPAAPKPKEEEKTAYMTECDEAGVPLPPKWGDPNWKKQPDDLPPGKTVVVIPGQTTVEVWIYESTKPPGVCYSLPRKDSTGNIIAMGIICQGESGSACFWDNKKPSDGRTTIPVTPGLGPSQMADGRHLEEVCTNCHRGDNAFVITPGTSLVAKPGKKDQPTDLPNDKRPYKPIGGPKDDPKKQWTNEPGDLKLSIAGCTTCHSIPKLTSNYCGIMNKMFVDKKTMPPEGDYDQDDVNDINSDLQQIIAACKKLKPPYDWKPPGYKWTPPAK